MTYSIDTSAVLEAWKRHYPPDVFGSLWEHLDSLIKEDRLFAIDEVKHELQKRRTTRPTVGSRIGRI